MTKLRYLIAGFIACLIHGIALSYTPQKQTINMSTEQGTQSLQIQLMAKAAKTPEAEKPIEKKKTEARETKKTQPKPIAKPAKSNPKAIPEKPKTVAKKKPQPKLEIKEPDVVKKVEEMAQPEVEQEPTPPAQTASQESKPMLVKKAEFRAKPTPVTYPRLARKKGLQGKVMIEVWLDEQGEQIKQVLLESSGHDVLDDQALKTIKKWRFSQRVEQGRAIAHRVQIPINFQLQ